jgi:N6-adenosine-specific RNA methylase IME4/ParB-like chromosome segregation protein Spo0J
MARLQISKIKVRNRYRKSLGEISSLAASIKELGLLHPIVVRPDGRLIAGERRLTACRRLGWKTIPVTFVDLKEVVRGEFAENAHRKDFLPSEIEAIRRAIEPYERKAAKERQRKHGGTAPGRRKHSGQISTTEGRTRDRIGAFAGISGRSLEKIQAIMAAAERQPRRFGPLVAEMDRTRRIDSVYRKLRQIQDADKRLAVKPPRGKFRTLCVDPPWAYSAGERSRPIYSTRSQKELLALPVASWADDQAHLYLWSTNLNLPDAFELMDAWGFKFVTLLTWVKPSMGLGSYFRTTTEHVLFGVRGRLLTRSRKIGTHFEAPKSHHSAKPEPFYQMVQQASYPPFLDVFARQRRTGWTVWGSGVATAA